MAAVAVAASINRKADTLKVRNVELDFEVTRLHSKVDLVNQFRVERAKLGRDVEETTALFIHTAKNMMRPSKKPTT